MATGPAPVAFAQTRRHVAARREQHCDPVDLDSSIGGGRIVGWKVVTVTDDYLANNAEYAKSFEGPLPLPPKRILTWA